MRRMLINVIFNIDTSPRYYLVCFTKTQDCLDILPISGLNPLNAELNPICHLLALLGVATIVVVSRLRFNIPAVCNIKQVNV